jgi:excisionase family DNA binding protein
MPRQMLTIHQAAEYLGTSARHVRRLVSDHALSHYKVGGRIRFADVDLDAWLECRRVEHPAEKAQTVERRATS